MRAFLLQPSDTLFLRDGRPFNQGEGAAGAASSVFPPHPPTVVGALRAAFAGALGWRGGAWPQHVIERLGDGDDLGPLRFHGPYLTRSDANGAPRLLLPAPRHVVRDAASAREELVRLLPSRDSVDTDAGPMRLPVPERAARRVSTIERGYVDAAQYADLLAGELAAVEIIDAHEVWRAEPRTGIVRDPDRHATGENALYNASHVRLLERVGLAIGVSGASDDLDLPAGFLALGGESRMVWVESAPALPSVPRMPELEATSERVRYTVTLLTPGRFCGDGWRRTGGTLPPLPGHVVSACVGRPTRIGGWDGVRRRPRPIRDFLPAGSTFFMETDPREREALRALHGSNIGLDTPWGYGQVLIGAWRYP